VAGENRLLNSLMVGADLLRAGKLLAPIQYDLTAVAAAGGILVDDTPAIAELCTRAMNERRAGGVASAIIDSDLRAAIAALEPPS
jgi:hypothetical protein